MKNSDSDLLYVRDTNGSPFPLVGGMRGRGVAPLLSLGSIWRGSRPFKTTSATEHPFCYFCLTSIIHIYGLQIDQYMVRTFFAGGVKQYNNNRLSWLYFVDESHSCLYKYKYREIVNYTRLKAKI